MISWGSLEGDLQSPLLSYAFASVHTEILSPNPNRALDNRQPPPRLNLSQLAHTEKVGAAEKPLSRACVISCRSAGCCDCSLSAVTTQGKLPWSQSAFVQSRRFYTYDAMYRVIQAQGREIATNHPWPQPLSGVGIKFPRYRSRSPTLRCGLGAVLAIEMAGELLRGQA